jgi:hypothetical protein
VAVAGRCWIVYADDPLDGGCTALLLARAAIPSRAPDARRHRLPNRPSTARQGRHLDGLDAGEQMVAASSAVTIRRTVGAAWGWMIGRRSMEPITARSPGSSAQRFPAPDGLNDGGRDSGTIFGRSSRPSPTLPTSYRNWCMDGQQGETLERSH